MKKNGVLFALVLVILLFSACIETTRTTHSITGIQRVRVHLKAIARNQTILDKTIEVEKGSNAFEVMKANARIKYTEYEFGPFIEEINGVKPAGNEFWALYVNGEMASHGINAYSLNENTEILWKIEPQSSYLG